MMGMWVILINLLMRVFMAVVELAPSGVVWRGFFACLISGGGAGWRLSIWYSEA